MTSNAFCTLGLVLYALHLHLHNAWELGFFRSDVSNWWVETTIDLKRVFSSAFYADDERHGVGVHQHGNWHRSLLGRYAPGWDESSFSSSFSYFSFSSVPIDYNLFYGSRFLFSTICSLLFFPLYTLELLRLFRVKLFCIVHLLSISFFVNDYCIQYVMMTMFWGASNKKYKLLQNAIM